MMNFEWLYKSYRVPGENKILAAWSILNKIEIIYIFLNVIGTSNIDASTFENTCYAE